MDISGGAAIITGSSSVTGIGAETAKALAAKGCNVVINYSSNEEGAEQTAALCAAHGVETLVPRLPPSSCLGIVELKSAQLPARHDEQPDAMHTHCAQSPMLTANAAPYVASQPSCPPGGQA